MVELTVEEQTDLDELQERIEALEKKIKRDKKRNRRNMWDQHALDQLKEQSGSWYDDDGGVKNELPPELTPTMQFSPEAVVGAEGWQVIHPTAFWPLSKKMKNSKADPAEGLKVSVARSNGCIRIFNQYMTAIDWRDNAEAVAKKYGASARLIRMAGYRMADNWEMLPTMHLAGASKLDDYSWTPEVAPFNEDEQEAFKVMFIRHHFTGGALAGAHLQNWALATFPRGTGGEFKNEDGKKVVGTAVGARHYCYTIANHPQWIIPTLMDIYNTSKFKTSQYVKSMHVARAIDRGSKSRVNGYESLRELGWTGGERGKHEPSGRGRYKNFGNGYVPL